MDVNMPIMNGIETTKWLTENHPEVYVLALTVEEDESTILKMIRAGAKGYLLKDVDKKTLEFALLKTIETGFYHSNIVVDVLVNSVTGKNGHMEVLKDTETEFLKLLCTEMTYKEIANKMNLSPKTIDGYRDNLFVKLNVKNRIGLVIYAIKNKIFTC
jgi:DNA-binding NarL/FixJ family response regulator